MALIPPVHFPKYPYDPLREEIDGDDVALANGWNVVNRDFGRLQRLHLISNGSKLWVAKSDIPPVKDTNGNDVFYVNMGGCCPPPKKDCCDGTEY